MRTHLTVACLVAVSQAINFESNISLAQTAACPPPCNPSGDDFNPDTDHEFHTEIDVTKDVIKDETEIVEEVIDDSGVKDLLKSVVGCDEASDVVDKIVKPIVELEIADMLPIKQAVDVITKLNDDEVVKPVDFLPSVFDVVKNIFFDEERAVDEPEIQMHTTASEFTPAQMDAATVTEITGPNGEDMELIVVNKTGVVVDDSPCPDDDEELEEKAEEIAEEVVDEIEEAAEEAAKPEPEPESESEEEEPEKEGVYKTTVPELVEDEFALMKLVQQAKGKPVILDFQYDACGHCQEIAPEYEQMMKEMAGTDEDPKAFFRKVDIYKHKDRLQEWGVKRFPTFKVFALGHEIDHLEGKESFYEELPGAIAAAFELYVGVEIGQPSEPVTVIDCSTVPDVLPDDTKVEDIFDEIDANDDGMIGEEEGQAAMVCAYEKGWITAEESKDIFSYFASHAGEDDLDIQEMKTALGNIHEVTRFDFGLETENCTDLPWKNSHGHTCEIIATDKWAQGDWVDTQGVRADEACCKFGGGIRELKVE